MTETLPWLEQPLKALMGEARNGRLPHAILITGVSGLGKTQFAMMLGKRLLCENPHSRTQACSGCGACRLSDAGSHPDFRTLTLEEGKNEIKVDHVRELTQFLALTSQRGRGKVAILDPAERMNVSASNALLKTLEEPTDETFMLLVTSVPGGLPATIRSRCQRITLRAPTTSGVREWLGDLGKDAPEWMVRMSAGAPLRLAALLEQGYAEERQVFFEQFRGLVGGQLDVTVVCEGLDAQQTRLRLGLLVAWLQDMVRLRLVSTGEFVKNIDLGTELATIAARVAAVELFRRLERAEVALRLSATSVNRQLLLEDTLLPWCGR